MEIIDITTKDPVWDQVWKLYMESFPEYERRKADSHTQATKDGMFHTKIAYDADNFIALIFYWQKRRRIYIEHIAVNQELRGKNYGSTVIKRLQEDNPGKIIVLEIDPPVDEVSQKRLRFYERLGFRKNNYQYTHPSYAVGGKEHELVIMSYPRLLRKLEFKRFVAFMQNKVLSYVDSE